ncbi:MAG TPA: prolipoprotein diacylglyceryl transferase [Firmicutes bacterium]|nr:prolipoprotein diacylglyceryl transferase [Bacillota bacterium]
MKPIISFPMLGDLSINPPNSFEVFGFSIYWYGVIIAAGFLLAVLYCMHRCGEFGLNSDNVLDTLIVGTPLAIIGARLYYVVFYFDLYRDNLWEIFAIRDGGLAIYGGIIGAIIGLLIVSHWRRFSAFAMLDLGCFGMLIGQFVGRWGNFINREAYGAETEIFCRMGLTDPVTGNTIYVHPTFLYESLWNFLGFVLLHIFSKKFERRFDGQFFLMYVAWYGFGRMLIEGLRTDSLYIPGTAIRVSQLLGALSCAAAVIAFVIMWKRSDGKKLWKNRSAE